MTPLDVIRREQLTGSLAPDGRTLLYLKRPEADGPGPASPPATPPRADVWVMAIGGEKPRNLTETIDPHVRFGGWAWSPSGRRVAIAGMIGPSMTLWAWNREDGRLRKINDRPLQAPSRPTIAWASEDRLLVSTLPEDAIPPIPAGQPHAEPHAESVIGRQWARTDTGREPSRSIVESGLVPDRTAPAEGRWVCLDLRGGLAESGPAGIPHPFGRSSVAPDGHAVAYLTRSPTPPIDSLRFLSGDMIRYPAGLAVATAGDGAPRVQRVAGVSDVNPVSLSWSPDGVRLAFVGRREGDDTFQAFVYDPGTEALDGDGLTGLGVPTGPMIWGAGQSLVVLIQPPFKPGMPPGRPDWWEVRRDDKPRDLTGGLSVPPSQLVPEPSGAFLAVAGGDLWRISTGGGPATELNQRFGIEEARLAWPTDGRMSRRIILTARRGGEAGLHLLDLERETIEKVARPSAEARLSDHHPATGAVVFAAGSQRGSSLWAGASPHEPPGLIAEANTHLSEIAEPTLRKLDLDIEDAGGRKLVAWLVLPPGYDPSRRWPLVALVYGGVTYPDGLGPPPLEDDPKLLAAHGYVVLLPSIPQTPGEPLRDLSKAVLAAVDKAVDAGIADPQRLGVMGHSYGGYTVYGLITQTSRFRVAVASAGPCDLVSMYGEFTATMRHSDAPLDPADNLVWAERFQGKMGVPLWKDVERYARNSPITYVGRVETPLLILHGDMDFIPIQQGEEFFTSLHRRGKRARFVRYWGEGHGIGLPGSPANYLDKWSQVYRWLDEYIGERPR